MKSIFAAGTLMLAAVAMPATLVAQDGGPNSAIVVSGKYQKDWNKGSEMEAAGLGQLSKANKDLVKYSADVVDAQNKRDTSSDRAGNASSQFRSLTTRMPSFNDADEAMKWAKQVEKAASNWAKYDDRRGDGGDDLEKAMKQQRKAQSAVDKAQAKVERGRLMKANAERLSMMQGK